MQDLKQLLEFLQTNKEQRDYSMIARFIPQDTDGNCVYGNPCQPCLAGIDIGLVNKYYDLACAGDRMTAGHYRKLTVNADACISCGHCDGRCPSI